MRCPLLADASLIRGRGDRYLYDVVRYQCNDVSLTTHGAFATHRPMACKFFYSYICLVEGALYYERDTKSQEPKDPNDFFKAGPPKNSVLGSSDLNVYLFLKKYIQSTLSIYSYMYYNTSFVVYIYGCTWYTKY